MIIQFNTDKIVNGDQKNQDYFTHKINHELAYYKSHITRIEVHVSDQNGIKDGMNDILCLLEARLEGRQPIAVSCQDDNIELAVSGAIQNLKAALTTILGRLKNH